MTAIERINKAKMLLVLDHPFYASIALQYPFIEDKKIKTAATNGRVIKYNPAYVDTLTDGQVVTLIAHEGLHNALEHPVRREGRDFKQWNEATDYVINATLSQAGFSPILHWLHDKKFYNMDAEHVFPLLKAEKKPDQNKNQGEQESQDFGGCGEVEDLPDPENGDMPASAAEVEQWKQENKEQIFQATQTAKMAGNIPNNLWELIDKILTPKVSWANELRNYMEKNSMLDYNWEKANEEQLVINNMYMPTLDSEKLRNVIIAVDTSGSCWHHKDQFATEISSLLSEINAEIKVIYFDTRVTKVDELTTQDLPLSLDFRGGGGTDFRAPFEYIAKEDDPSLVIVLTDLECDDYPEREPDCPVLWVCTPDGTGDKPKFGDVIRMN